MSLCSDEQQCVLTAAGTSIEGRWIDDALTLGRITVAVKRR